MEIGLDGIAASSGDRKSTMDSGGVLTITNLLDQIELADKVNIDVFGIGEHYRKEVFNSAPVLILAAAASRTKRVRLTSAVTVLGAADPVRVFQNFATLDLISNGRAEIIVGRGSSTEAFPLFGYGLQDYDEVFAEKLDLLLNIRQNEFITWSGKFRPSLNDLPVYPRSLQKPLPVWLGVGGTPTSFIRAGTLGLPLMVAVIGGETDRFRPLIDLYKEAGAKAGHSPDKLKVGLHSLGYVAHSMEEATNDFYPAYAETMNKTGIERGWPMMTRQRFETQLGPRGALLVGTPEVVAEKILRHDKALGGISRLTFAMGIAGIPHSKVLQSIELIGSRISPLVNQ